MENKKLVLTPMMVYKFGNWLLRMSVAFWLFETIIFIAIYGWHWTPYNEIEKEFDKWVSCGFLLSIVLHLISFLMLVENTFTSKQENEKNN